MVECTIDGNNLPFNSGNPQHAGGGVSVGDPTGPATVDVTLERCTISNNDADHGSGGGLFAGNGTARLVDHPSRDLASEVQGEDHAGSFLAVFHGDPGRSDPDETIPADEDLVMAECQSAQPEAAVGP